MTNYRASREDAIRNTGGGRGSGKAICSGPVHSQNNDGGAEARGAAEYAAQIGRGRPATAYSGRGPVIFGTPNVVGNRPWAHLKRK